MRLSSLIYFSERSSTCTEEEIQNILQVSTLNNALFHISGILLYTETHFIQYIEGNYDLLMPLYKKIISDSRHNNVELLDLQLKNERVFPTWAMASKKLDESFYFISRLNDGQRALFNGLLYGVVAKSEEMAEVIHKVLRECQKQVAA